MLSSNAPFNEKGFAQVIRDLENLYLTVSGSRQGDMGTSTGTNIGPLSVDQTTEPDGFGGSPLATLADLDAATAAIPRVTYPISIANGGTGATTLVAAMKALGIIATGHDLKTSGSSWSIPAGIKRVLAIAVGGGGGNSAYQYNSVAYYVSSSFLGTNDTSILVGSRGGGAGGAVAALLDVSSLSSLTISIGSGGSGTTLSGAATAGGDTTISATGIAVTAKGGGAASDTAPGYGEGINCTFSGASVMWAYGIPGQDGRSTQYSTNPAQTNAPAGIQLGSGLSYGWGAPYGTSALGGSQGAILFIY